MEAYLVAAEIATEPLMWGRTASCTWSTSSTARRAAPFCAGVCEVFPGAPVDFDYDDDAAVCYMLEGDIILSENGENAGLQARRRRLHPAEEGPGRLLEHRHLRPVLLRHLSPLAVGERRGLGNGT